MRFPLKLALSAVLAKTIAAELNHMAQNQQVQNELDANLQGQQSFRQAVKTVSKFSILKKPKPVKQCDLNIIFKPFEFRALNNGTKKPV